MAKLVSILLLLLAAWPPALGETDDSWPMLAHDCQRSGCTADEIRPPFARKWYRLFPDEGIMSGVQPIVMAGKVFIPTLRGALHAVNAETGRDEWIFNAGAPLLHAAAADDQRVYFGSANGWFYAAHIGSGKLAWRFRAGPALWNSPALFGGKVFFGGRGGKLEALDAASGTLLWESQTGGPLLSSPAVDPTRGRVYIGCEDMRLYAFDLATGQRLWISHKLPGVSLRGYYPVVAPDGSVIATVAPGIALDRFTPILLDMVKKIFGDFASWRHSPAENAWLRRDNFQQMQKPETYRAQLDYLRRRLEREPAFQTFFVFDPDTGRDKFIAPVVYGESMNGPQSPPLVTPQGRVILKYQALLRSRYEQYSPFLNVGYLNTTNGWIEPIMDQGRTYGWHDSLLLVHDEQCQLMAAGRWLINTHQNDVNGLDLETLQGYAQPFCRNIHEPAPGEALAIWLKILRGEPLPPGKEWLARGTAVYGGGSVLGQPISVAGDSFYYLPTHEINAGAAVIAYRMTRRPTPADAANRPLPFSGIRSNEWTEIQQLPWDWDTLSMPRLNTLLRSLPGPVPGGRQAPLAARADAQANQITDADLDSIIWRPALKATPNEALTSGAAPGQRPPATNWQAQAQSQLRKCAAELLNNDWRPLLFPAGKFPEEAYRFFDDPSETLYTLALAYRFLDPALQNAARQRAHALLGNAQAPGIFWTNRYAPNLGLARSLYTPPPEKYLKIHLGPERSVLARLYPLWLWADQADDWPAATNRWSQVSRQALDALPSAASAEDCGNADAAGWIALCRLARVAGDDSTLAQALPRAREALRRRLRYEFAFPNGGLISEVPAQRTIFSRWSFLTPDVADALRRYAGATERRLMQVYVDYQRPSWWLSWNVELMWRNESPYSFPTMSQQIFAARSLILKESGASLCQRLDLPWCKGDEFYLQKLALLLWNS